MGTHLATGKMHSSNTLRSVLFHLNWTVNAVNARQVLLKVVYSSD